MFLTLEDVVFTHPFPAIISILLVLGMFRLGRCLTSRYPSASLNNELLGYILLVIIISILTNFLATIGFLNIVFARTVGAGIAVFGVVFIVESLRQLKFIQWRNVCTGNRELIGYLIVLVIITSLFLIALSPPTDADSLDYHLGVPLDWFRNNGAYPRPDWNHSRVIGIGESINLFGLQNGTDILGQLIQYSGLWIIFISISKQFKFIASRTRLALLMLVFAVPLNLFLATIQKPQLFQAALVVFVLFSLHKIKTDKVKMDLFLLMLILFYVIGSKVSFLITGGITYLYGAYLSYKYKYKHLYLWVSFFAFLIVLFPVYLRAFSYYGDPLSPMFEFLKNSPSVQAVHFAESLKRSVGDAVTLSNVIYMPFRLSLTLNPGLFSTVLGAGFLIVLYYIRIKDEQTKDLILFSAIVCVINVIILKQTQSRYYLEVYWVLIFIYMKNFNYINNKVINILIFQATAVMIAALVGVIYLFPGSLTDSLREKIMIRSADGYEAAKWMDQNLPINTYLIAHFRSHTFTPRQFISADVLNHLNSSQVLSLLRDNNINALFIGSSFPKNMKWIVGCADFEMNVEKEFYRNTRNPLNQGEIKKIRLMVFDPKLKNCNV